MYVEQLRLTRSFAFSRVWGSDDRSGSTGARANGMGDASVHALDRYFVTSGRVL